MCICERIHKSTYSHCVSLLRTVVVQGERRYNCLLSRIGQSILRAQCLGGAIQRVMLLDKAPQSVVSVLKQETCPVRVVDSQYVAFAFVALQRAFTRTLLEDSGGYPRVCAAR